MSAGPHLGRWAAAGGAVLLVGAGLLTREGCAPIPAPAAHAPSAPASAPRADAPRETVQSGPAHTTAAASSSAPDAAQMDAPPPARAAVAGPWAAAEPPGVVTADTANADATAVATPSGTGVPPVAKQELALLASIERDLKREPPPEVHALLREYRRGADRATLVSRVQHELPKDLQLRVTVLRWIDEVRPDPGRPSPVSSVPGQGTGAPWVRPIQRR